MVGLGLLPEGNCLFGAMCQELKQRFVSALWFQILVLNKIMSCCVWFRNYPGLTMLEATTLLRCFFVHYNWLYMYVSIFSDSTVVSYWVIEDNVIFLFVDISSCFLVVYWLLRIMFFFLFVNISSCFLVVYRILFLKARKNLM